MTMLSRELKERGADLYATLWTLTMPVFLVCAAAVALGPPSTLTQATTGAWMLIYLASTAVLDTSLGREQQQHTAFALLWSDGFVLFLAKTAASICMLTLLELIAFPLLFAAWLEGALPPMGPFLVLILCVNLCLSALSVLVGMVSLPTRNRSTVLVLLGLPLMLPLLLLAGKGLADIFVGIPIMGTVLTMLALSGAVITVANTVIKEVWWL